MKTGRRAVRRGEIRRRCGSKVQLDPIPMGNSAVISTPWSGRLDLRERPTPGRARRRMVSRGGAVAVQRVSVSDVHTQLLTDDASGRLVERRYRLRVVGGP